MRYYRCKCGKQTAHSSMGVAPCDGCEECQTTLAESPDGHDAIAPHDWQERFAIADETTGARKKERVCRRCMRREPVTTTIRVDGRDVQIDAVDVTAGQIMVMARIDPTFWIACGMTVWSDYRTRDDLTIAIHDGMEFHSGPPGTF